MRFFPRLAGKAPASERVAPYHGVLYGAIIGKRSFTYELLAPSDSDAEHLEVLLKCGPVDAEPLDEHEVSDFTAGFQFHDPSNRGRTISMKLRGVRATDEGIVLRFAPAAFLLDYLTPQDELRIMMQPAGTEKAIMTRGGLLRATHAEAPLPPAA